jgi:hypothetical protein
LLDKICFNMALVNIVSQERLDVAIL